MVKYLAGLFLLMVTSVAMAEVPIVFTRCEATPDWEYTRTVTLSGGGQVQATRNFKMEIADRVNEVAYPISTIAGSNWTLFLAPCNIVYRDTNGVETNLYDCIGSFDGTNICSAQDAYPSPNGEEAVFTVFNGTLIHRDTRIWDEMLHPDAVTQSSPNFEPLPNKAILADNAQVFRYNINTSQLTEVTPATSGIFDINPIFSVGTDGKLEITFSSNRTGHTTNVVMHTTASEIGTSLYVMDLDGSNIRLASAHSRTQEQHPIQVTDGRICYSSWQTGLGRPFSKTQGQPGQAFTILNAFPIWCQYPDGSRNYASIGQHSPQAATNSSGEDLMALHFFAELPDGKICANNYYRGNNQGMGAIACYPLPVEGIEGQSPFTVPLEADMYLPTGGINMATWAINSDGISPVVTGYPTGTLLTHPNYTSALPFNGKIGWPFAIPASEGAVGLTWGKGYCSNSGLESTALTAIGYSPGPLEADNNGENIAFTFGAVLGEQLDLYGNGYSSDFPGCNLGIYKSAAIPIDKPSDLVMIVDTKDHHEFAARAMVPYSQIYGIQQPATLNPHKSSDLPKGTPFGLLGSATTVDRETIPRGGVPDHTTVELHAFHLQGTEVVANITDDEICGIRIMQFMHNRSHNSVYGKFGPNGEAISILGEFYTKNRDGNGDPILWPDSEQDTSWLVEIPANVPYTMAGIDCLGRNINIDPTWQHLKPREIKTCNGCHVHSGTPDRDFNDSYANSPSYTSFKLGRGQVPLLEGVDGNGDPIYRNVSGQGLIVNYREHIRPIFQTRCVSCHSGVSPAADLNLGSDPANEADDYKTKHTWPFCDAPFAGVDYTYARLVYDNMQCNDEDDDFKYSQEYSPGLFSYRLHRPLLSKYIRAYNSRGSLLYWKAANERTDNRQDSDFSGDIDFGANHPVAGITTEELGLIARWIDTGSQAGPNISDDNMDPTLSIEATLNGSNQITDLVVGTVDLGSGIDTTSLDVRVVTNGTPGANIAPAAHTHGIVGINLASPISSDPNVSIRATVNDLDGNTTTIEYTSAYLIDLGDETPPAPNPVDVNVGGNTSITVNNTFNRTITFTDSEDTDLDGWTYTIDWCGTQENGSISAGQFSFGISRLFSQTGSCLVSIEVFDGVGESDSGTFTITINPEAPAGSLAMTVGPDVIVREGNTLERAISFTDGGDEGSDGWTYQVDWGSLGSDSGSISAGSSTLNISRTFTDAPKSGITIPVTVTITDSISDEVIDSFNVYVLNERPTATITGNDTVSVGQLYTLNVTVTDAGDDTGELSYYWGNGTVTNSNQYTYPAPGTYIIKVYVTDEDSIYRVGRKRITVN